MGTNFYFRSVNGYDKHIGKRSASGYFCWNCHLALKFEGNHMVHQGCDNQILKECLICGNKADESIENSTAWRELGFNKAKPSHKTGVKTCSSFTWAISPGYFADLKASPNLEIEDEYGTVYTIKGFADVLKECPIQFFDSIGTEFC